VPPLPLPVTPAVADAAPLPLPLVALFETLLLPPLALFVLPLDDWEDEPPVGEAVALPVMLPAEAAWLFETVRFCEPPVAVAAPVVTEFVGLIETATVPLGLPLPFELLPCAAFCDDVWELR